MSKLWRPKEPGDEELPYAAIVKRGELGYTQVLGTDVVIPEVDFTLDFTSIVDAIISAVTGIRTTVGGIVDAGLLSITNLINQTPNSTWETIKDEIDEMVADYYARIRGS